jgi:hypothetical protein
MPFDSVCSIGGQSFVDGVWRLLGPALQGLTNPLPVAIPGFANARMRVTQLVPVFPGSQSSGGLTIRANVEMTAEALLHVLVESGSAAITIGTQSVSLANLAGPIAVPPQAGTLSNIAIGGTVGTLGAALTGGTGDVALPGGTSTLSGGTGTGTLGPGSLALPGIPLPAVVPVPVNLTQDGPLLVQVTAQLTVSGPDAATRFGLLFTIANIVFDSVGGTQPLALTLTPVLQEAVRRIVAQLGTPIMAPTLDPVKIGTLIADVPVIAATGFVDALTELLAETGRLIYPPSGAGASCDVNVLPTAGSAALSVATGGSYVLQVGFERAGSSDIPAFPPVAGPIECEVLVGNSFLLGLLCCLVERLPAFSLPVAAVTSTVDVAGTSHMSCCNFTNATANFGGIAIGGGGLSVCIDGAPGGPKNLSLVGSFAQSVALTIPLFGITPNLGSIAITADFTLPLAFDFDDAASIANLRMVGTPSVSAAVVPNMTGTAILVFILAILVPIAAVLSGLLAPLGALLGAVMASVVVLIVLMLVQIACAVATRLLGNAVRMLLSGASLLRSPVALPPGLFEAFGRIAPATVTVDDLKATGVLHTPSALWGVLPRLGPRRKWIPDWRDVKVGEGLLNALQRGGMQIVHMPAWWPGLQPKRAQKAQGKATNSLRSRKAGPKAGDPTPP